VPEDRNNHEESYAPTWHALLRDVHALDKDVTVLKLAHAHLAEELEEIKAQSMKTNATLSEVRDTILGWKGSLVIITSVGGAVAAIVFYGLDRVLG
jgi:hypothetical protein